MQGIRLWIAAIGLAALAGAGLVKAEKESFVDRKNRNIDEQTLRRRLTPEQYKVTRENGTEPPFKNEFWNNHADGLYVDVVSGEPLFSSREKFDSGTGWPSFTAPLARENVVSKTDRSLGMARTEVRSKTGDSHLGHVFDDGPGPEGKRYCINSASLRFIPADRLEAEGYGQYAALFGTKRSALQTRKATFAAGCFWGVEAAFGQVKGVVSTRVGYTGGSVKNPTYAQVCSGNTGHAEAIEVTFDPAQVSYAELLEMFWKIHDPTTRNRQGPDVGSQYRSAIFTHDPTQAQEANAARDRRAAARSDGREIVTQIVPAGEFFPAEEYHQKYAEKNGGAACHL